MTLREQFCKEYYKDNKNYLPDDQKGIEIGHKEYARWLETKLQNKSHNRNYAECADEIIVYYEDRHDIFQSELIRLLKNHL